MSKGDPSVGFGLDSYEKEAHKGLLFTWLHDYNQRAAMGRGGIAKANGLPPDNYAIPFPGSVTNTKVNNFGGLLAAVVLTAATGALGLAGWNICKPNNTQPPINVLPSVVMPPATNTSDYKHTIKPEVTSVPIDIEVTWKLKDSETGVDVSTQPTNEAKASDPAPKGKLENAPLWNGSHNDTKNSRKYAPA